MSKSRFPENGASLRGLVTAIITPHIATESVKLSDAVVDFWCENLRRFAENRPLLGAVDRQAGY
jgi:phosphoglycerate dehydrogenase-like enzyme